MLDKLESKRMSHKDTMRLIEAVQRGSEEAKEELILGYKNLVYDIVSKVNRKKSETEDVVQIGMLALLDVVERFDTSTGHSFTTYAYPYIYGTVTKYIKGYTTVKVPRTILDLRGRLFKYGLTNSSIEEISESLNEPNTKLIADTLKYINNSKVSSFSDSMYSTGDGNDITIGDTISKDLNGEHWEDCVAMLDCLSKLDERSREVINLCFFKNLSQKDAAKELGIGQAQVNRIKKQVILTLRAELGIEGATDDKSESKPKGEIKPRVPRGDKAKAIELLRDTALTLQEISDTTGVPYGSLYRWSKENRPKEVSDMNKRRGSVKGNKNKFSKKTTVEYNF